MVRSRNFNFPYEERVLEVPSQDGQEGDFYVTKVVEQRTLIENGRRMVIVMLYVSKADVPVSAIVKDAEGRLRNYNPEPALCVSDKVRVSRSKVSTQEK